MHETRPFNTLAVLAVPVLALALLACSREPESSRSSPSESRSSAAALDISSLDVCARVPVVEVAKILGQEQSTGSAKLTQGRFATDCTYTFERNASSKYAILWLYPVELWAPEARDDIENVSGLGDAAYLTKTGSFAQMHVLVQGELYLDARADTPEQARGLAELALARLRDGKTSP